MPVTRVKEGLCRRCFDRLGGRVTQPKIQSYLGANPELEKQGLNLLFTWRQGDHSSVTVPEGRGRIPTLGRGCPGQGSLQRARWLLGESVTNPHGSVG